MSNLFLGDIFERPGGLLLDGASVASNPAHRPGRDVEIKGSPGIG